MKKKFDKNKHDRPEELLDEQYYIDMQSEEEARFLRLTELLNNNKKGCGDLLSAIYLEGLDYTKLSEQLGVPEATLRQRKKRCLDNFRKVW